MDSVSVAGAKLRDAEDKVLQGPVIQFCNQIGGSERHSIRPWMKVWGIIAENLSKAGWSWVETASSSPGGRYDGGASLSAGFGLHPIHC